MPRGSIHYTFPDKAEYELASIENELLRVDSGVKVLRMESSPNGGSSVKNLFKITIEGSSHVATAEIENKVKTRLMELSGRSEQARLVR